MGTIPKKESVYGMNVGQDSLKNPHWQPEEQCLKDVCDYEAQYRFGFLGNFKFDLENIIYKEEACKKKHQKKLYLFFIVCFVSLWNSEHISNVSKQV